MDCFKPKIRRMDFTDIPGVMEIERASSDLRWTENAFRFETRGNDAGRPWVAAAADGTLLGFAVLWFIVDEMHVANLAVDPAYRRQGIGFALLRCGLLAGWDEGARISFLEVRAGNRPAISLYQKIGYFQAGVRKKYYQDNQEDALLMNLETEIYRQFVLNQERI